MCADEIEKEHEKALLIRSKKPRLSPAKPKRSKKPRPSPTEPTDVGTSASDDLPRPRLQRDEITNFLKLSTALKLLLATHISDSAINRASKLLEEYLLDFGRVSDSII